MKYTNLNPDSLPQIPITHTTKSVPTGTVQIIHTGYIQLWGEKNKKTYTFKSSPLVSVWWCKTGKYHPMLDSPSKYSQIAIERLDSWQRCSRDSFSLIQLSSASDISAPSVSSQLCGKITFRWGYGRQFPPDTGREWVDSVCRSQIQGGNS